jgi:holliday junction DNA helicase RuvA
LINFTSNNTIREEALSALVSLGFNRINVQKALNSILNKNPGVTKVEELIKFALKSLS